MNGKRAGIQVLGSPYKIWRVCRGILNLLLSPFNPCLGQIESLRPVLKVGAYLEVSLYQGHSPSASPNEQRYDQEGNY